MSELDLLLTLFEDWYKCPSVNPEGKWFYYRRGPDGIAYRLLEGTEQWSKHWFLHVSQN